MSATSVYVVKTAKIEFRKQRSSLQLGHTVLCFILNGSETI